MNCPKCDDIFCVNKGCIECERCTEVAGCTKCGAEPFYYELPSGHIVIICQDCRPKPTLIKITRAIIVNPNYQQEINDLNQAFGEH